MSDEQKDAQIGRFVRERKEAIEETERLGIVASEIGSKLEKLARILKTHPHLAVFDHDTLDARFTATERFSSELLDYSRTNALVTQYREERIKAMDATEQLKRLGITV